MQSRIATLGLLICIILITVADCKKDGKNDGKNGGKNDGKNGGKNDGQNGGKNDGKNGNKGKNGNMKNKKYQHELCADKLKDHHDLMDQYEDVDDVLLRWCDSGCCFKQQCCDPSEEGKLLESHRKGWKEAGYGGKHKHGHDGHHGSKAFKIVTIALSGVIGLTIIVAVVVVLCKKTKMKKRRTVGTPSAPEVAKKYLADDFTHCEKTVPVAPVEASGPPAYYIPVSPPPAYFTGIGPSRPGSASAPPSYSTIDLREAAARPGSASSTVVHVKPATDRKV